MSDYKPEVGTVCECKATGEWFPVEIMYVLREVVVFQDSNDGFVDCKNEGSCYQFRPVKSQADIERDEAIEWMLNLKKGIINDKWFVEVLHDNGYRNYGEEVSEIRLRCNVDYYLLSYAIEPNTVERIANQLSKNFHIFPKKKGD